MNFINTWIAKFLESFKTNNPKIWMIVFVIASILQFGIQVILPGVNIPPGIGSLDWILLHFNITVSDNLTDTILWVLMAITGSRTTAYLPEEKREEKIKETKVQIKEVDAKREAIEERKEERRSGH